MRLCRQLNAIATIGALLACSGTAHAQRASENAIAAAEDAFGTSVGLEQTGIYSDSDTRGFNPLKAGNARIDGIYFDPVSSLSGRLRASTAIRVGMASEEFPFHAPTGIADYHFRPYPDELGISLGVSSYGYGGIVIDQDIRLPVIRDHLALTGGFAFADVRSVDGSNNKSWGWTVRPIFRFGGAELAPFAAVGRQSNSRPHTLVSVSGASVPELPDRGAYLGQNWTDQAQHNENFGVTLKAPFGSGLSLRAGVFHAVGNRIENFSEIYSIDKIDPSLATHRIFADPAQDVYSTSGEALLALSFGSDGWQHRLFAGFRGRDRYTETGGSDVRTCYDLVNVNSRQCYALGPDKVAPADLVNAGLVAFGQPDPREKFDFVFTPVNSGRVRQSAWMIGYIGKLNGFGTVNLGLQKARYRATSRKGSTGQVTRTSDDPWLYNATFSVNVMPGLAVFVGTERGLEDSGTAPESANNRNDQLPATRTTQYEGGLRWKFHGGQLVLSAFQITKPYFSFDKNRDFVELGQVRHRGFEASLSGHFGPVNVVAGAVAMQPRVSGAAVDAGLLGSRPAGTPSLRSRVDVNYRTSLLNGLTLTASWVYTGRRALGSRPLNGPGSEQLMLPGFSEIDFGLRHNFKIGTVPVSARATVTNVFDAASWKVSGPDIMYAGERRRFQFFLAADF